MQESTKEWLSRKLPSRIRNLGFLIHAIRFEDEDYIDNVKTDDVYINGNYFDDGTPLHVAARIGNYQIFQKLIHFGADIHKRNQKTQETVLDSAMKSLNYDIVRYLKENGVRKSDRIKGETALHFAAEEGTKEVMTLLLTNCTEITARSDEQIALIIVLKAKHYHVMNAALMKNVLDLFCTFEGDADTKTIFDAAADIDNYKVLKNWLTSFSRRLDIKQHQNFLSYFTWTMGLHNDLLRNKIGESDAANLFQLAIDEVDVEGMDSIKRYIIELLAAGFYVSGQNIRAVSDLNMFDGYSAKCALEVQKMKNNVIEGTSITFIDILHKNVRYLARYLMIIDLTKILIRESQFREYPIYENKIFFKLWKAQIRVNYVKDSEEVLYNTFYELQLPDIFIRELYLYLSNDDLKKFIQPSR